MDRSDKHPLERLLPKVESSEIACENNGRKLLVEKLLLPSGHSYDYVTFVSHDVAVMVLAITPEGKFVMLEEYRHPTGKILLGLPGGCVDPGEQPKDASSRELFEETGYKAEKYTFLGKVYPMPGNHGQQTHYFLAEGAYKASDPTPELCEIIRTQEMTLEVVQKKLLDADALDGHITSALCFKMIRGL